jgi:adenylate kinase family enzyme
LQLRAEEGKRADDTKEMIQQRIQAEEKNLKLLLNSLRQGRGPLYIVDAGGDVGQIQVEFRKAVDECIQQL